MSRHYISEQLDALIQAIYQGPLEPEPWLSFLQQLRLVMKANYASLLLRPPREGDVGIIYNALVASPEISGIYKQSFFSLDPFVNLPPGKVVTLREFMPTEQLLETEYYQQYMEPIDVFHNMGADMIADGLSAGLRITRPLGAEDFDADDKELCQLLLPHLQQSIVLHSHLKRTETEREIYADAIDQLSMGIIILDDQASVQRTNKAAENLLAHHGSLRIKDGKLVAGDKKHNRAFHDLLKQVLAAHNRLQPGFIKAFRLGPAEGGNSLGMLLRPLPLVESSKGSDHPCVAIFISDPNQRRVVPADVLMELYGFTPAESALALLLANGLTLDEASQELGVSRNTAKSHLSAVFSKTGLTRQTKLVQLILKSVATFARAPLNH